MMSHSSTTMSLTSVKPQPSGMRCANRYRYAGERQVKVFKGNKWGGRSGCSKVIWGSHQRNWWNKGVEPEGYASPWACYGWWQCGWNWGKQNRQMRWGRPRIAHWWCVWLWESCGWLRKWEIDLRGWQQRIWIWVTCGHRNLLNIFIMYVLINLGLRGMKCTKRREQEYKKKKTGKCNQDTETSSLPFSSLRRSWAIISYHCLSSSIVNCFHCWLLSFHLLAELLFGKRVWYLVFSYEWGECDRAIYSLYCYVSTLCFAFLALAFTSQEHFSLKRSWSQHWPGVNRWSDKRLRVG